jgi:membrane protease YdiL (CAAX protease family)
MEPVTRPAAPEEQQGYDAADQAARDGMAASSADVPEEHDFYWLLMGPQGLRVAWSVLLFWGLYRVFLFLLGAIALGLDPALLNADFSPTTAFVLELIPLLAILGAGGTLSRIEHRRLMDYNLTGPRRTLHFISGLATGFAVLSVLVGAMAWGGWVHFGPVALRGTQIAQYGALWALAFLLTGFFEEGSFRCYLQFTLTRGINFWWALGMVGAMCLGLMLSAKGQGAWGVYAAALLGLIPCWLLHRAKAEGAGFWQAAWATSTAFGYFHTGNNGENWIGIFAAAAIGFVFCVSVRVTGSAWWAIGCHSAWDWAETFFYGTADSGLAAKGHYLTTSPSGSALWSGGADGPEGSLLVVPVILLLLAVLLALYGRRTAAAQAASTGN